MGALAGDGSKPRAGLVSTEPAFGTTASASYRPARTLGAGGEEIRQPMEFPLGTEWGNRAKIQKQKCDVVIYYLYGSRT